MENQIKPKPSIKLIIIFITLGLSLIIISGVTGYYLAKKQSNSIQSINQLTPTTSIPPTSVQTLTIANEMDRWNIYSNSTHYLSFKYPNNWTLNKKNDSDSVNANLELKNGEAVINMAFNMEGIGGQGQNYQGEPFKLDKYDLFKFKKENTYNNTQIIGITDSLTETLGLSKINGKTYSIYLSYPVGIDQSVNLENDFDQILSTFKFLDKENITITQDQLDKGWYWGSIDQKLQGTPDDWTYQDAGRSSCWHKLGIECY